jgi:hypothetical protein
MRLTASDIFGLYRPTECPLRVYLRQQGVKESEPSAFERILETLGERHELEHLALLVHAMTALRMGAIAGPVDF